MKSFNKKAIIFITVLSILTIVESVKFYTPQPEAAVYNITDSQINAMHSSLAYCGRSTIQNWNSRGAKQLQFKDPVYLYDNFTEAAGYIGYRSDTKSIVVSFRGSSNKKNWEEDFNFQMLSYPRCKDCFIHAGFYFDFSVLSPKIYEAIDKLIAKYDVQRFVATGHSLGGALALVTGLEIKMNYGSKFEVEVHTFGQPRVGNGNLAQFMKLKINTIFRVIHNQDLIPHVPFEWLKYVHPATEVFFSEDMKTYKICNESGEDPNCSNKFYPNYSQSDHDFYFFNIDNQANCKLAQDEQ